MDEILVPIFFWSMVIFPVIVFVLMQVRQTGNIRTARWSAVKFFLYSALPPVVYGLFFIVLLGVESMTGAMIIGEGYARTLVFVVGIGLAWALCLSVLYKIVCIWRKIKAT